MLPDVLWLVLACCATLCWGFWGFFAGVAERRLGPVLAFEWHCLSAVSIQVTAGLITGSLRLSKAIAARSVCAGLAVGGGLLFMLAAFRMGCPTGLGVVISSLYPVGVAILNVVVLKEFLTTQQISGVFLGSVAIVFLVEPWVRSDDSVANWKSIGLCVASLVCFVAWGFLSEGLKVFMVDGSVFWQGVGLFLTVVAERVVFLIPWTSGSTGTQTYGTFETSTEDSRSKRDDSSEEGMLTEVNAASKTAQYEGIAAGLAVGVFHYAGLKFFMLSCANASSQTAVVVITSLYSMVTVALARIFLGEILTVSKYAGAVLAVGACSLLV